MSPIKNHGTEHTAKYLILLGSESAPRALLFGHDRRFLAEIFDDEDGLVRGNLMRAGTSCPPPVDVTLPPLSGATSHMQCFLLD